MHFLDSRLFVAACLLSGCDHGEVVADRTTGDASSQIFGQVGTGGASGSGGRTTRHAGGGAAVGEGGTTQAGAGGTTSTGGVSASGGDVDANVGGATSSSDASVSSSHDASVSSDASTTGGPPSCVGIASTCGPDRNESCCTSLLVTGGTFTRNYDGVSPGYTTTGHAATVSNFLLDRFEITIGRFRKFIDAWDSGYRPAAGDGKHSHLNGGNGLSLSGGGYEPGWDPAWNKYLGSSLADAGGCGGCYWTSPPPPGSDDEPMYGVAWYDAYAFCVWDGGFLPSDSEWNYAAAGGAEQRVYPWSAPPSSLTIDCSYAFYIGSPSGYCTTQAANYPNVGAYSPKSDSKYGQADLAGGVWEWNLDWEDPYITDCVDCTATQVAGPWWGQQKTYRGGAGDSDKRGLLSSLTEGDTPYDRIGHYGARCARSPATPTNVE